MCGANSPASWNEHVWAPRSVYDISTGMLRKHRRGCSIKCLVKRFKIENIESRYEIFLTSTAASMSSTRNRISDLRQ